MSETVFETPKKPTRFEVMYQHKRIIFEATISPETGQAIVSVIGSGAGISTRLTAHKTQELIAWLQKYAAWTNSIPNQGGR